MNTGNNSRRNSLQVVLQSPRTLIVFVLFLSVFVMAVRSPLDTDMWWHLRLGQEMIDARSVARVDLYSHTAFGNPMNDHGWLSEVILAAVYGAWGPVGLSLLVALVVVAAAGFIYTSAQARTYVRVFVTLLAMLVSSVVWAPRPQIFSLLMMAAFVWVLVTHRADSTRRRIWALPLLTIFWTNLHASFAAGFAVLGAFLGADVIESLFEAGDERRMLLSRARQLALVLIACLLVAPLNPNGLRMYLYPFETVSIGPLQAYIQEWASPDFHQFFQQPFIWQLVLLMAAIGLSGKKADGGHLAVIGLFTYMSLLAVRNIGFFALATAPILALNGDAAVLALRRRCAGFGRLSLAPSNGKLRPPAAIALNALIALVLLGGTGLRVALVFAPERLAAEEAASFPRDAVAYLEAERPSGPLFNSYNWGGYLVWNLYPTYKVFVDGRTDLYSGEILDDYIRIASADSGWEATLDKWNIGCILIEKGSLLSKLLSRQGDWHLTYEDDIADIFVR